MKFKNAFAFVAATVLGLAAATSAHAGTKFAWSDAQGDAGTISVTFYADGGASGTYYRVTAVTVDATSGLFAPGNYNTESDSNGGVTLLDSPSGVITVATPSYAIDWFFLTPNVPNQALQLLDITGVGKIHLHQYVPSGSPYTGTNDTFLVNVQENVPEPATLAVLGMGMAGLAFARRRKV